MSSFFTLPGSAKRKRSDASGNKTKKTRSTDAPTGGAKRSRKGKDEDEISSESEDDNAAPRGSDDDEDDEELANETAAERRIRLAQQYLDNLKGELAEEHVDFDAAEIDRDLIAERLREDVAADKGRLYRFIADDYSFGDALTTLFRMDGGKTTGIAACNPYIYTVTANRYLAKWKLPDFPRPEATSNNTPTRRPKRVCFSRGGRKGDETFEGHTQDIVCVAASQDGKFVATGGKDHKIVVWNAEDLTILKVFKQHRGTVTGLVFRRGTNELYSASSDRTVKLWSLNELAYVETLFGHQDEVVNIAALSAERCVTVGARDRTARLWKIVDETQLVFRGGGGTDGKPRKNKDGSIRYEEGSMDVVAMIDDEHFVTGSDNGNLCLWSVHKKKPIHTIPLSHGVTQPPAPENSSAEVDPSQEPPCPPQPRYVTALAIIPYANLIFSGSWDGVVRVWKVTTDKRKLEAVGTLGEDHIRGVINSLAVFERGEKANAEIVVCAGTGKGLRLGNWLNVPGRDGGYVMEVKKNALGQNKADDEEEDDE